MMKIYKIFIIVLSIVTTFYSFLSPSIAQEMGGLPGSIENHNLKLSTMLDPYPHNYYFTLTEGKGGSVRLAVSESFSLPTVNDPPQLSGGRVVPDSGGSSTDFYYYVEYYDRDEDIPETTYVYIDNVAYVMSLYSGKGYDGTYRYGPKLLKAGSHDFYFSFTEENHVIVRVPPEGSYSGPVIATGSLSIYDNIGDAAIILDGSHSGYTTPYILSPVSIGTHKVSLLKSGYVSFPPFAMIKVVQEQIVEVPFILMPCPASIILQDESYHLHLLRSFRDKVLNQTSRGREYIDLYYTYASEISLLIINDPDMRIRIEKILKQFVPLLTPLVEGESVFLPSEMKEEIGLLLDDFEVKGSRFLNAAVKKLRNDLNKGELFKNVVFEREADNSKIRK